MLFTFFWFICLFVCFFYPEDLEKQRGVLNFKEFCALQLFLITFVKTLLFSMSRVQ